MGSSNFVCFYSGLSRGGRFVPKLALFVQERVSYCLTKQKFLSQLTVFSFFFTFQSSPGYSNKVVK